MDRRNFLKGAASLAVLPSLPTPALAALKTNPVASAAANSAAIAARKSSVDLAYIWCRQYAETRVDFQPKMLTQHLGFAEDIVQEAFARMIKNEIVQRTAIEGVYKSTKPFTGMANVLKPTIQPKNLELIKDTKPMDALKELDELEEETSIEQVAPTKTNASSLEQDNEDEVLVDASRSKTATAALGDAG